MIIDTISESLRFLSMFLQVDHNIASSSVLL